ncbi:glycolate oxidase subunit GlcE [Paraburkholderia sacchari]|uniref:glycolate oxidase subunit GlcE n=1 Tax=Paraburkholderia sacchari TaxID=159450 RepID=UPI001BCE7072|nr:glycolate oxidase subunit GlcE [Paraburkholderia sacchari]
MKYEEFQYDDSDRLIDAVANARATQTALSIRGGNTKAFLGRPRSKGAVEIDTRRHRGIVRYEPTELVVTVRAGTPVGELTKVLEAAGQILPCEPPEFGGGATVGGMVASGLSGPRRPWSGAVRDFVLGCRVITGEGKHLRFGGEVMKNVAGFDVSRLMAGSFGCLALITEVSLKVLPRPRACQSRILELSADAAMAELRSWRRSALPVTGACFFEGRLVVRLEGGAGSVSAAADRIGGEAVEQDFWKQLREHELPFFDDPLPLWRLSLPVGAPLSALPGKALLDWGGAQRWLKSVEDSGTIRRLAREGGGHAVSYSPEAEADFDPDGSSFAPLQSRLSHLHRALKARIDPNRVFNPGRLYAEF